MGVEEWVRDLAITLRVLETSYPYNVFPIAKIVGQARRLGLSLKKAKYVVRALEYNRFLFVSRRVSRYTFFGLSREGREYADMILSTMLVSANMSVFNSVPFRVRLSVMYKFPRIGITCNRMHNISADIAFVREEDEGECITEPIKANNVYGVIRVMDKGFEYESLNLHALPRTNKPVLNRFPILRSLFRYIIAYPKQAYEVSSKFAKTLLYVLAFRPQLLNVEVAREFDTVIIKYGGKRLCCECVDPEICIHGVS